MTRLFKCPPVGKKLSLVLKEAETMIPIFLLETSFFDDYLHLFIETGDR